MDPLSKKLRSKGYGFVEFFSHADALACLRYLNANTSIIAEVIELNKKQGKMKDDDGVLDPSLNKRRPIVEFAVENRMALLKRDDRVKKMKSGTKRGADKSTEKKGNKQTGNKEKGNKKTGNKEKGKKQKGNKEVESKNENEVKSKDNMKFRNNDNKATGGKIRKRSRTKKASKGVTKK